MRKMLILTLTTLFLLMPKELFARLPWQKTKPSILITLQVWPNDNSQSFLTNIETEPLTGYKSKRYSIWFNTNEIFCEAKVGGAQYSVFTSSIGKSGYLVQFYQSPENGGSIMGSLMVPIRKPFPGRVTEVEGANHHGIPYRVSVFYSSNKKEIDGLSKFFKKDNSFSCEVRPE